MKLLVFPNQLFAEHPGLQAEPGQVVLVEDSLFFGDNRYPLKFHKQKIWLHRATMKRYEHALRARGFNTLYLNYDPAPESLKQHLERITNGRPGAASPLIVADPDDYMLKKRLHRFCNQLEIPLHIVPNPGFLNQPQENQAYRAGKQRWFMADFYRFQRQRLGLLMNGDQPQGGKWSFDAENRKKVPKKLLDSIPPLLHLQRDRVDEEAREYVATRFADHPGNLERLFYPTSHSDASKWLGHFLKHRLARFGDHEDAMVEGESWLWHGVLTPALNTGLLTPARIVEQTLAFSARHEVPLNSLEGFLRQLTGWREFIRATYQDLGVAMRTSNHWNHVRKIPASFYDGTTGILPVDDTIRRILETGYCHHIERLMVLGGFMFLCEFHPDEVYRWFMEMFVDSYDWVMVPNVYAMSQHADGGLITTKPYFSGSAYIRKMSHYRPGPWCKIWDGLYWRWIRKHADKLARNPRWAMMCSMARKMDAAQRQEHLKTATRFLQSLAARNRASQATRAALPCG